MNYRIRHKNIWQQLLFIYKMIWYDILFFCKKNLLSRVIILISLFCLKIMLSRYYLGLSRIISGYLDKYIHPKKPDDLFLAHWSKSNFRSQASFWSIFLMCSGGGYALLKFQWGDNLSQWGEFPLPPTNWTLVFGRNRGAKRTGCESSRVWKV